MTGGVAVYGTKILFADEICPCDVFQAKGRIAEILINILVYTADQRRMCILTGFCAANGTECLLDDVVSE